MEMKVMKKTIIAATLFATAVNAHTATAEYTEAKQAGAFFTSSIAGAALGGPIGFIAGALGGVWLGEELKEADAADAYQQKLATASETISGLSARLREADRQSQTYAKMALEPLELQMLFKTNESELSAIGMQRIALVAEYLIKNTDVSVQLDGYADPRGSVQDNLTLSQARVDSIAAELEAHGLETKRINRYSHGSTLSQATDGDYDAYALERVVSIKMYRGDDKSKVAQTFVGY
jgi:outer membrane protein OmpA-like peptidoglycan-associated protein